VMTLSILFFQFSQKYDLVIKAILLFCAIIIPTGDINSETSYITDVVSFYYASIYTDQCYRSFVKRLQYNHYAILLSK